MSCDITIVLSYNKDVTMPAQIPTEKPASKTTPQIVNMFRRTMILDEMMLSLIHI